MTATICYFMKMNHVPDHKIDFKTVTASDCETLLDFIQRYYKFDEIPFHEDRIRSGLAVMTADETLGRAWLVLSDGEPVGYALLTFGFDLEFGGRLATLTDLYLSPGHRGRGVGRKIIRHLEDFGRSSGLHALELQVELKNVAASEFYKRMGFTPHDRVPMWKPIERHSVTV